MDTRTSAQLPFQSGENLGSGFRDRDGVLEVSREAPIGSNHGPTILEGLRLPGPEGDHGLDGNTQPWLDGIQGVGLAIVGYRRPLMELPADPVPDLLSNDSKALWANTGLDRMTDVADSPARSGPSRTLIKALPRGVKELPDTWRHCTHRRRKRHVHVVPPVLETHVDGHDVSFFEWSHSWDPVYDLRVG